jgi:hypothetical protein
MASLLSRDAILPPTLSKEAIPMASLLSRDAILPPTLSKEAIWPLFSAEMQYGLLL